MLTLRIANYLNGTVRIRISGVIPEKFINLCLARGILLWSITKRDSDDDVYASLRLPDFFRIRPLARMSQTRISVVGFAGLPFAVKRIKRRKMMVVGAVLFLVLLNLLSSYVWFVEVTGAKEYSGDKIRSVAREHGLRPGVAREKVDLKAVENGILLNTPEIAWVGINVTGTRAVIEVVEKNYAKPEDKSPAHIFAAKDGVITEVIVLAGQAAVKKGDTVKKGDLLIKGIAAAEQQPATPGQPTIITLPDQYIRANGLIKARTWYESYGEASLVQEIPRRTGREVAAITVQVGERQFVLNRAPEQPFAHFETEVVHKKLPEWRNRSFPVESTISIFREVVTDTYEVTTEQARDLARSKALDTVQNVIPESAQVLSHQVEILKTAEPGIVRAKVTVETIEDIGQTINITH